MKTLQAINKHTGLVDDQIQVRSDNEDEVMAFVHAVCWSQQHTLNVVNRNGNEKE